MKNFLELNVWFFNIFFTFLISQNFPTEFNQVNLSEFKFQAMKMDWS